jgi:hypothetical protein
MKEKFFIVISLVLILVVLIGLNAASYTKQDKLPDNEYRPNRSTFNTGATGTRAYFDLLKETGHKVVRWQDKPAFLLSEKVKPNVFVIIGETRMEIPDSDVKEILDWTAAGGKLVLIDREPNKKFFEGNLQWKISFILRSSPNIKDPYDQTEMTAQTAAIKPVQPTVYTNQVNAIQPSRLSSSMMLFYEMPKYGIGKGIVPGVDSDEPPPMAKPTPTKPKSTPKPSEDEDYYGDEDSDEPPPMATPKPVNPKATPTSQWQGKFTTKNEPVKSSTPQTKFEVNKIPAPKSETYAENSIAPVVHFQDKNRTILVDYKYGAGEIVLLSDPYIVANNGIKLVDNAQLAINLVSSQNANIAFDEYHQGFGASQNNLWTYFSETPVPALFGQIALFIGLIFFVQSRRFARPLPDGEKNRLSKLEYVSAMAELQQSTKAYDLAIENIFSQFKRHIIRFAGADNSISHKDLAQIISERSKVNPIELYNLLNQCQAIVQGERTSKRELVELTKKMREIEEMLGLKRKTIG